MRIKVGQRAPDFRVPDVFGRPVALSAYAGSRVLLAFHRFAACPLCDLRMWHLIQRYPRYQRAGLDIIVFTESSRENALRYLEKLTPPFPLVADLERQVYGLYGLERSPLGVLRGLLRRGAYREAAQHSLGSWNLSHMDGAITRMPGDFLIGPDQRVQRAYYGRDAGDFLLFSELEALLGIGSHDGSPLR